MKPFKSSLSWSAGVLLFASAVLAQSTIDDEIHKEFAVKTAGKVTLEADRGAIEIRTGESDSVRITVNRKVSRISKVEAEEIFKDHEITFDQTGDEVIIRAKFKGNTGKIWNRRNINLNVHYMVTVPRKYNLDVKTSGGNISIPDIDGEARARTSGGNIDLGKIEGLVAAKTSGGSITLKGGAASAELETSGGNITVGEVAGHVMAQTSGGSIKINKSIGDVVAKTSGGGINLADVSGKLEAFTSGGSITARLSQQPKGNCSVETSGGSIDVQLADSIRVDLDASTSGGRVTTDFPVEGGSNKSSLRTAINGGGPVLVLKTSGGNVRVRKL